MTSSVSTTSSFSFDDDTTAPATMSHACYALVFGGELARAPATEWLIWLFYRLQNHGCSVQCNGLAAGATTAQAVNDGIQGQSNMINNNTDDVNGLRRRAVGDGKYDDTSSSTDKPPSPSRVTTNTESADVVIFIVSAPMTTLHAAADISLIQDRPLTLAQQFEMTWYVLKEIHVDDTCRRVAPSCIKPYVHHDGAAILAELPNELLVATPLHDNEERDRLWLLCKTQMKTPANEIRNYYGEQVAFYFDWMNTYNTWLCIPAVLGVLLTLFTPTGTTVLDNTWIAYYSLGMVLWAACFLKFWTRRASLLAFEWGTSDVEQQTRERPEFSGDIVTSPITGKQEKHFARLRRLPRYIFSMIVSLAMLSFAVLFMACSLNLQGYTLLDDDSPFFIASLDKLAEPGELFDANSQLMWLAPCIIHCTVCFILNKCYSRVAHKLTEWENHKTEADFENSLIVKRVLFESLDCFLPLLYIAFIQMNMLNLRNELISLFAADEIRRVLTEVVIPWIMVQFERRGDVKTMKKVDTNNDGTYDTTIFAIWQQSKLFDYEPFDEYLEMTIQFGYVILFAAAFPLAGVISLISNMLELRSDSYKLSFLIRRPRPVRVANIGSWVTVMKVMGTMCILTNCWLFAFASNQMSLLFPWLFDDTIEVAQSAAGSEHGVTPLLSGRGRRAVAIILLVEHLIYGATRAIGWLIHDVPKSVKIGRARQAYIKSLRTPAPSSASSSSTTS